MERVSRRLFLEVGSVAAVSSLLPGQLQAQTRNKLKPLVIFFQAGAQSPYEFIHPLVDAPAEMRGTASAIRAKNGELIDERWPEFASVADKVAVIKSIDAQNIKHRAVPVIGQPSLHGETLATGGLPHPYIETPSNIPLDPNNPNLGIDVTKGMVISWNHGERRFVPPALTGTPELQQSLPGRLRLLEELDQGGIQGRQVERFEKNRALAASLLGGGGEAIEQPFANALKERERYGNHPIGDACALGSQLAQSGAGVTFIYNEYETGWDHHANTKEASDLLIPPTDKALKELILDSRRHGFTLLMTTEHGRTRKLNNQGGRDHFEASFAILSGENVREGVVIGNFTKHGDFGPERFEGSKLMRTAYQASGIDHANKSELITAALKS